MKLLSSFVFFAVAVTTAVLNCNALHAEPGFYKTTSRKAPAHVRGAASAVYRYVILNERRPQVLSSDEYVKAIAHLSEGSFAHQLAAEKLAECVRASLPKCENPYAGSGTAFIIGEKHDQLMTVRHNLKMDAESFMEILGTPEDRNGLGIWLGEDEAAYNRNMPLHFMLFDSRGKAVFDTRVEGDFAAAEIIGLKAMAPKNSRYYTASTLSDFALIRLSRPVGKTSLAFRNTKPAVGEKLTVIGFPKKTHTRKYESIPGAKGGLPDSNGIEQYYSTGAVFPSAQVLQFMMGPAFEKDEIRDQQIDAAVTYADLETVEGFSGSPVIDAQGKVAGISVENFAVSSSEIYAMMNSVILHTEWLNKNLKAYAPYY